MILALQLASNVKKLRTAETLLPGAIQKSCRPIEKSRGKRLQSAQGGVL